MAIEYPTSIYRSSPTPAERLMICDKCQRASWHLHGFPNIVHCSITGHGRMREGSKEEYRQGKAAIKKVIGGAQL